MVPTMDQVIPMLIKGDAGTSYGICIDGRIHLICETRAQAVELLDDFRYARIMQSFEVLQKLALEIDAREQSSMPLW